jgi:hypothetical protein
MKAERAGDGDALLLPTRELLRKVPLAVADAEVGEQLPRAGARSTGGACSRRSRRSWPARCGRGPDAVRVRRAARAAGGSMSALRGGTP